MLRSFRKGLGLPASNGMTDVSERLLRQPHDTNATLDDLFYCFRLVLGRIPSAAELAMHKWRVGQRLEDVVATFLRSQEFDGRNLLGSKSLDDARIATLNGFSIFYQTGDIDAGVAISQGVYEPEIEALFRRIVGPGMTVVDVGANIGFYTMLAASLVGPAGRVVAIEPNPVNVKLIEASRRENGFQNVEVHAVAANDTQGALVLNTSYSNGSVHGLSDNLASLFRSELVYGAQLDRLLELDRLDFLKIDVEGAEHRALSGFKETLKRFRPTIVTEFSPAVLPNEGRDYLSFLFELGYRVGVVQPSGAVDDKGVDREAVVQAWRDRGIDHIDLLATPEI